MSKEAINEAVNKVAVCIRGLTGIVEENREALTPEAVEKISFYLHSQLDIMVDELRKLAVPVAIPKLGSFSIDMELPTAPAARPTRREGRMVRSADKAGEAPPAVINDTAYTPTIGDQEDIADPDGAGFL